MLPQEIDLARNAFRTALFGMALALGLAASEETRASTLSFVIDKSNSAVTLTRNGNLCLVSNCGTTAVLASALTNGDTYTVGTGDSIAFDFLTLTGKGTGLANYAVTAVLAFSSPYLRVATTGNLLTATAVGRFIGGRLTWDAAEPATTIGGSTVKISFASGEGLFDDGTRKITTTATITGISIVPLPATGLLLAAGLGGLGLFRRGRAQAA